MSMKTILKLQAVPFGKPQDMESMEMDTKMEKGLSEVALSIFADCVNSGMSLQKSVLAVYLSGLHHGSELGLSLQKGEST